MSVGERELGGRGREKEIGRERCRQREKRDGECGGEGGELGGGRGRRVRMRVKQKAGQAEAGALHLRSSMLKRS